MHRLFDINPFFSKLIVGVSNDPYKELATLNLAYPGLDLDWDQEDETWGAVTYETGFRPKGHKSKRHTCVIVFNAGEVDDPINAAAIAAHEAVHVVNHVMENSHVQQDSENDELQAYLTGYITECALKVISEFFAQNVESTKKKPKTKKK